jgi:hypothetical protein
MHARVLVGVLLALALGVGTASASTDPYRDQAETIVCPSPPSGWFNPPESEGGRVILTPLTAVQQVDDPTLHFAAPLVQVTCHYRKTSGKDLQVSVRYALPIDVNPWNDLDIGCTATGPREVVSSGTSAGAYPWSDYDRAYRIVGAKSWSLATFAYHLDDLSKDDVPRFEAMANAMLKAAQPFAHGCPLAGDGGPANLRTLWTFRFDARTTSAGVTSSGKSSGSFLITSRTPVGTGAISELRATDIRLSVRTKGRTRSLKIRVGGPTEFRFGYVTTLAAQIRVIASNDTECRKGSTGTLSVSTEPRVLVNVCGRIYLGGKGSVRTRIASV